MRAPWKIVNAGFHDALQPQNVQRTSSNSGVLLHYEMLNFQHYRQCSMVNFLLSEVVLVALLHIPFRLCKIIQDLLGKIESCDCNLPLSRDRLILTKAYFRLAQKKLFQVGSKETMCCARHFRLALLAPNVWGGTLDAGPHTDRFYNKWGRKY